VNATVDVPIVKMHGAHNAFVLIDERPVRLSNYPEIARKLCVPDGELGGADGILVVRDAPGFAAEMRIFNADGSEAEMCGNGVRCVARYLLERGAPERFAISTLAGTIGVEAASRDPFAVRVDIGPVSFPADAREETAIVGGRANAYYEASLGNPHAVVFVEDVNAVDLPALGVAFNALERFPHGTNVHVVQRIDAATLRVRHYERGVGLTQACGTGAVACAAVAIAVDGARPPIVVEVPGGTLRVDWTPGETARLTGPAETIFERTIVL